MLFYFEKMLPRHFNFNWFVSKEEGNFTINSGQDLGGYSNTIKIVQLYQVMVVNWYFF